MDWGEIVDTPTPYGVGVSTKLLLLLLIFSSSHEQGVDGANALADNSVRPIARSTMSLEIEREAPIKAPLYKRAC